MNIEKQEFLPEDDFKILRVIKIIDKLGKEPFVAYLPYLRKYEVNKRNFQTIDELDENILTSVRSIYANSELYFNEDILIKGRLEKEIKSIPCTSKRNLVFTVDPDNQKPGEPFIEGEISKSITIPLTLRIYKCKNIDYVTNALNFQLPINSTELDNLIKTIKVI